MTKRETEAVAKILKLVDEFSLNKYLSRSWMKNEILAILKSEQREGANQTRKRVRAKIRRMKNTGVYFYADELISWIRTMDERQRRKPGGM